MPMRKLVLGIYVVLGVLTFLFQTAVRLPRCAGPAACTVSVAKGAAWSAIWPASWVVYGRGLV
jgi:hypothetical protein